MPTDAETTARLCAGVWGAPHPDRPVVDMAWPCNHPGQRGEEPIEAYDPIYLDKDPAGFLWPVYLDGQGRHTPVPEYQYDDAASAQLRREMKAEGWEWKVTTTQGGYFAAFWKGDTICHAADADDRLAVLRAAHEALCPA